jgi:WD40 repeat protein
VQDLEAQLASMNKIQNIGNTAGASVQGSAVIGQRSALQQPSFTKRGRLLPNTSSSGFMKGHRDIVTCVLAHPIYNLVVSCGEDTSIKVWNCESCALVKTLEGHTRCVNRLALDGEGGNVLGE